MLSSQTDSMSIVSVAKNVATESWEEQMLVVTSAATCRRSRHRPYISSARGGLVRGRDGNGSIAVVAAGPTFDVVK